MGNIFPLFYNFVKDECGIILTINQIYYFKGFLLDIDPLKSEHSLSSTLVSHLFEELYWSPMLHMKIMINALGLIF